VVDFTGGFAPGWLKFTGGYAQQLTRLSKLDNSQRVQRAR